MPTHDSGQIDRLPFLQSELAPNLEVIRLLGIGRMAEVYLARQVSLDRPVAVKVLSPRMSRGDSARARFDREAKAAASLDTPHAVSVYQSGLLTDGAPFLVMQYVRGGTLEDRLEAEGPLSEPEARRILADMAQALAAAHEQNFVHRAVRAANVLCDRDTGRVLLSDFGLAGVRPESEPSDARITRTGEIVGTPGYLSPEQIRGERATEATDVFALGLMGYDILARTGPFESPTQRERILRSLREPPTPLRNLRPGIDQSLADLLERCLAKEPERRPSARFLAKAFRGEAGDAPADRGSSGASEHGAVLESLLKRRLPQVVVVTGVVLYAFLQFVDMLADRDMLPSWVFRIALNTFVCGIAASGVAAWFHGKAGKQEVRPLEVALFSLIGLVWLGVGLLVVLFR